MRIYSSLQYKWQSSPTILHFSAWILLKIKILLKIGFPGGCQNSLQEPIDVVIPTITKDYAILDASILSLKNVCHPIDRIYILSKKNDFIVSFCEEKGYTFVDEESLLGYGKERINYKVNGLDRSGWLFQQLLKLSGDKITDKENYLVLDSDTVLINKHSYITNNKFVFTQSSVEYHKPYFDAFEMIFKEKAPNKLSNTSHMMLFNTEKLREMKMEIEKINEKKWDDVIISTKDIEACGKSCFAEYELYPNWLTLRYPKQVNQRPLYNKGLGRVKFLDIDLLKKKYGRKYNSISFHDYIK